MPKDKKQISKEEVKKIAQLAKIELTEEEVKKFQKGLSEILAYVGKLDEVNTTGVEHTPHTPLTNAYREDTVEDSLSQEKALANRKKSTEDGFFKIKSVLNHSS